MLIYTVQKSKKRKPNAKQRELAQEWQKIMDKWAPKKPIKHKESTVDIPKLATPSGRVTIKYPSLNTGNSGGFKKETLFYTGDKMKGIGTLHKSNAVPIFTDEEAKDQANMRR
jgi:predicted transcriptional regulator YdeE